MMQMGSSTTELGMDEVRFKKQMNLSEHKLGQYIYEDEENDYIVHNISSNWHSLIRKEEENESAWLFNKYQTDNSDRLTMDKRPNNPKLHQCRNTDK